MRPSDIVSHLLDGPCRDALAVAPHARVLDCGCGEGGLAAALAADGARVVAFDRDAGALARAQDQSDAVDWRLGDVHEPPLTDAEHGSFDLVFARFVLEGLSDPQSAVAAMGRAARPGGRIALIDDDHEPLILWPPCPEFEPLWTAYCEVFDADGDSRVGRKLPVLLHAAGVRPTLARTLHFGGTHGEPEFAALVARLVAVATSRADELLANGFDRADGERAIAALETWSRAPGATIWHHVRLAIGVVASAPLHEPPPTAP